MLEIQALLLLNIPFGHNHMLSIELALAGVSDYQQNTSHLFAISHINKLSLVMACRLLSVVPHTYQYLLKLNSCRHKISHKARITIKTWRL